MIKELLKKVQNIFKNLDGPYMWLILGELLLLVAIIIGFLGEYFYDARSFTATLIFGILMIPFFVGGCAFCMGVYLVRFWWLLLFWTIMRVMDFYFNDLLLSNKSEGFGGHYVAIYLFIANLVIIVFWAFVLFIKQRVLEPTPVDYQTSEKWKKHPEVYFFKSPPDEIGEVIFSFSTLDVKDKHMSFLQKFIRVLGYIFSGLFFSLPVVFLRTSNYEAVLFTVITTGYALFLGLKRYYFDDFFIGQCSYIGTKGAFFYEVNSRFENLKTDEILFDNICKVDALIMPDKNKKCKYTKGEGFIISSMPLEETTSYSWKYGFYWYDEKGSLVYNNEFYYKDKELPLAIETGMVHKIKWMQKSQIVWKKLKEKL